MAGKTRRPPLQEAAVTVFDLLFLVLFLTGAGALIAAGVNAVRGRKARAATLLKRCGVGLAVYLSIVVAVSLLSPQRFSALGDSQCSDDWCIAVSSATRTAVLQGSRIDVDFRLSSRARGVAQRERFVTVYLRDSQGRRYDPEGDTAAVPFDTLLAPGQSITASRSFVVPEAAVILGLVVAREGGGRFPGCCIIGDESSLFHKRTIVRLGSGARA
jgi:hypothetical protein